MFAIAKWDGKTWETEQEYVDVEEALQVLYNAGYFGSFTGVYGVIDLDDGRVEADGGFWVLPNGEVSGAYTPDAIAGFARLQDAEDFAEDMDDEQI